MMSLRWPFVQCRVLEEISKPSCAECSSFRAMKIGFCVDLVLEFFGNCLYGNDEKFAELLAPPPFGSAADADCGFPMLDHIRKCHVKHHKLKSGANAMDDLKKDKKNSHRRI